MDDLRVFTLDRLLPPAAVFGGYIMIGSGILAAFTASIAGGIVLCLAGIGISFTSRRVLLNVKEKKVKQSWRIYGLSTGRWRSINGYPYICIQKVKKGYSAYSWGNVRKDFHEFHYLIYLISNDKKRAIPIDISPTLEEARRELKSLSEALELEVVLPDRRVRFK